MRSGGASGDFGKRMRVEREICDNENEEKTAMEKPKWMAPSLTVVVRIKPEEHVLDTCKNSGTSEVAPGSAAGSCLAYGTGGCGTPCSVFTSS